MQGTIELRAEDEYREYVIKLNHRISIVVGDIEVLKLTDFKNTAYSRIQAFNNMGDKIEIKNMSEIMRFFREWSGGYNDGKLLLMDEYAFTSVLMEEGLLESFFNEIRKSYILIVARYLDVAKIRKMLDKGIDTEKMIIESKCFPISSEAVYMLKTKKKRDGNLEITNIPYLPTYYISHDMQNKKVEDTTVNDADFVINPLNLSYVKDNVNKNMHEGMPISFEYSILGLQSYRKAMKKIKIVEILKRYDINANNACTALVETIGGNLLSRNANKSLDYIYENYGLFANEAYSLERFFEMFLEVVQMVIYEKND